MSNAMEISLLAKLLHQNGDKVLNSISKLSLNAVLLQKLNENFDLLIENGTENEASFQVISSHNGNSELVKDLHFLHDFVQKTSGLKLTIAPGVSLLENKVDISKFKSVKYLEIKKIPIKEIVGLKNVQSQLESIVCIRCLSMLEELLANCGGDNSSGFVWSELREAVLSFNSIKIVDTSIAFAPWLQVLDLSHNLITDVKAIECLPNLKYVNLSFNCLDTIPTFNKSARKKIELLVLKNNYIEELSGLNDLCHLIELDLSDNLVSDTESLDFLLSLSTLQWLSLAGNPISFHKNYRRSVCSYLHINASFSDFYLDKVKLSKKEKEIVGIKLSSGDGTLNSNHVRKISNKSSSSKVFEDERNKQQTSGGRKAGKARLIVIPNLDDGTYEEEPGDLDYSYLRASSTEHLITKKRIENTRSAYGVDNWLVQGSSVVQDILGLPPAEVPTSTPFDDLCLQAALDSVKNVVTTTAVIESQPEPHLGSSVKTNKDSFVTCNETESGSQYFSAETSDEKEETSSKEAETVIEEPEPVRETSSDIEEIKEEEVEIDENEKLYVVSKEVKTFNQEIKKEELFLTITDTEIQERELTRGKIVTKWSLSLIESCVKPKSNQLQLVFGTVRRDKKERTYYLDEEEANALYKQIAEILESRTLSDMNQVVYKCENCSSQFSVEIKSRKSESNSWCPFCNSKFILQLDEVPLPSYSEDKKKNGVVGSKPETKISHNRSSSVGGFFQSLLSQTDDKMLKCASQSSIGSAASLDEINELPTVQNTHVKRSDSDIEILSNPSQSSIEVIDGTGRFSGSTPLRKRSSEERQAVAPESVAAAINLIQGNNPTGLTESSSSGSVTDSICTAYESSSGVPPGENKTDDSKLLTEDESEKDKKNDLVSKESSDSLLQEALKRAQTDIKNKQTGDINYSFTDFTSVDHRVKYFLYTHVYEDSLEDFLFGIRGVVFTSNRSFPSYVSVSTKKLYLLEVINIEQGDDARNFLKKNNSLTFDLSTITCIYTLTWYQGFGVKIQLPKKKLKEYLVLLKDTSRTQNFLNYLTSAELPLLGNVQIIKETLERPFLAMQQLLLSCTFLEDSSIRHFCLLNFCSVVNSEGTTEMSSGGLLINSSELLLFGENLKWLFDNDEKPPNPAVCQKFANLIRTYTGQCRIILQFDDAKREIWSVTTETKETADGIIQAIKDSAEKLSVIPLEISSF